MHHEAPTKLLLIRISNLVVHFWEAIPLFLTTFTKYYYLNTVLNRPKTETKELHVPRTDEIPTKSDFTDVLTVIPFNMHYFFSGHFIILHKRLILTSFYYTIYYFCVYHLFSYHFCVHIYCYIVQCPHNTTIILYGVHP